MKLGKVSDTILSRSVLKPLNTVRGPEGYTYGYWTGCV